MFADICKCSLSLRQFCSTLACSELLQTGGLVFRWFRPPRPLLIVLLIVLIIRVADDKWRAPCSRTNDAATTSFLPAAAHSAAHKTPTHERHRQAQTDPVSTLYTVYITEQEHVTLFFLLSSSNLCKFGPHCLWCVHHLKLID